MSSSTPAAQPLSSLTNTFSFASGSNPTPAIECDNFEGTPLLPSASLWQCGTKTGNSSLMSTCCNGAEVKEYLGCFMYCPMEDITMTDMQGFVACLSTGGNSTDRANVSNVDTNVFCQGDLNATVSSTSSATTTHGTSKSLSFIFSLLLITVLLCEVATAECTVSIDDESGTIRQGEPRSIMTGSSCGIAASYCIVDQTGTEEILAANRTIEGRDASDGQYDEFFEALGESTDPPRLFAATSSIKVRQWAVGDADGSMVNWSSWVPFMASNKPFFHPSSICDH